MNEEIKSKIMEIILANDQAFEACESEEDILAILARNGLSLSDEQWDEFKSSYIGDSDAELSEDELDNVAGGTAWNAVKSIVKAVIRSISSKKSSGHAAGGGGAGAFGGGKGGGGIR